MSIKIIDNFLDEKYFHKIQSHIEKIDFPWYYRDNITSGEEDSVGKYGFNHLLIDGKATYNFDILNALIYEMIKVTASKNIFRCRLDMTVNRGDSIILDPHVDFFFPHISSILYINNSDGNTIIYNQRYNKRDGYNQNLTVMEEIEQIANRLLIFDGMYIHTGCTPSKNNRRILINSNFRYKRCREL